MARKRLSNTRRGRRHAGLLLAGLVALASLVGGCGSSATSSQHSTASAAHSTATASAASTTTASAATTTRSSAPGAAHTIKIQNFAYHAPTVTVKVGTRVTWTNFDSSNHTVTADNNSFDLGNLNQGQSKSMVFTKPGTYPYHCTYHPFMHGTVIVTP